MSSFRSKTRARVLAGAGALVAIVLAASAAFAIRASGAPDDVGAVTTPTFDDATIARGEYLSRIGDCAACHTASGAPDFAGGLALNSPLGAIYATNITPDPETGIGTWSLDDFDRALRRGIAPRHRLYPAMPYPSFAKASREDIAAMYAYFKRGVKPVRRKTPETNLPFPYDQRWGLALWNVAFLERATYRPDGSHDATWNRGASLVQGLAHCGSCHTPRGVAWQERGYDERSASYLTGGINDHWFAPNLTGATATGLGAWSGDDLTRFLKTGHGGSNLVFGPMMQVVMDSTRHVDDADVVAIATYLKALAPQQSHDGFRPDFRPDPKTATWLASGDVHEPGDGVFASSCARCHGFDGVGEDGKAPALAGAAAVRSPDATSIVHILLTGGKPKELPDRVPYEVMPAFAGELDDRQIAEVATFVRRAWGNDGSPVDERTVRSERRALVAEH